MLLNEIIQISLKKTIVNFKADSTYQGSKFKENKTIAGTDIIGKFFDSLIVISLILLSDLYQIKKFCFLFFIVSPIISIGPLIFLP